MILFWLAVAFCAVGLWLAQPPAPPDDIDHDAPAMRAWRHRMGERRGE